MPRALEPGLKFPIVLASDRQKPADVRPTFFYRVPSVREFKRMAAVTDDIDASGTAEGKFSSMIAALQMGLVGWEHMLDPASGKLIPFDPAEIDRLLDIHEANELMSLVMEAGRLSVDEKKS